MDQNTTSPSALVEQFQRHDAARITATWRVTVTRHDGTVEFTEKGNILQAEGLNNLAARAISDTASKYGWLAIGTAAHTPHINSQDIGEVDRKAGAVVGSSKEVLYLIATWGGAADSITSIALAGAGIANHQTSGSGHFLNHVGGLSTTLGDSDFLNLEVQVQVGSHAI